MKSYAIVQSTKAGTLVEERVNKYIENKVIYKDLTPELYSEHYKSNHLVSHYKELGFSFIPLFNSLSTWFSFQQIFM